MKMGMAVVMVSGRQATAHTRWGQANFREKGTRVDLRSLSSTASPIERNFQLVRNGDCSKTVEDIVLTRHANGESSNRLAIEQVAQGLWRVVE